MNTVMQILTDLWQIPMLSTVLKIIMALIGILLSVAYLTLFERKIIAAMQLRKGPNVVGPFGLFQPLADGLKLMHKETILPTMSRKGMFLIAPAVTFIISLIAWAVIPVDAGIVFADINVGILYLLAMSSLGVYGIIIAGWASNSKYAFMGALRSAAQMISYEVSIGLVIVCVLICSGSLNLTDIVLSQKSLWYVVPLFPMFVIFLISALAETNRAPFDLPEAEAELVSGYNVEYSSIPFAFFFLGEYANMILMSSMITILFLGGWLAPFGLSILPGYVWFFVKVWSVLFIFVWIRASFPRYRYDQLMRLGWKIFLPFSLIYVVLVAGIMLSLDKLPKV
jgi:NADH-quinone oxidoreductase subunit H